jgi:hypothetical protein
MRLASTASLRILLDGFQYPYCSFLTFSILIREGSIQNSSFVRGILAIIESQQ